MMLDAMLATMTSKGMPVIQSKPQEYIAKHPPSPACGDGGRSQLALRNEHEHADSSFVLLHVADDLVGVHQHGFALSRLLLVLLGTLQIGIDLATSVDDHPAPIRLGTIPLGPLP
jgi:hypothetical protein